MRAFLKNLGKFVYMQQLNKALSTLIVLFLAITMVFGEGAPFIVNATGAVMTGAMVGTMSAGGAVYGASMGAKIIAQGGAQALASRTGLTRCRAHADGRARPTKRSWKRCFNIGK